MSTLKTNNIQHVDRSDPSIIINTDGSVNIAGTMTYEDVTNVDSVGIVTGRELINAQKQIHVGTGVSVKSGGLNVTAGITTLGGDVSIAGVTTISYSGTSTYGLDVYNPTSGASGARFRAGDSDSQYALLVENGAGTNLFEVLAGGGGARLRSGDLTILDKIGHYGDGNTFIRFPAADTFTVETAGSERIRVDSSGNFGIGTDNPAYMLDVVGDGGGSFSASTNSTNGVLSVVGKNSSGGVSAISRIKSYPDGSSNQSHMAFETRNSSNTMVEALRITSGQKIGFNETNPSKQFSYAYTESANYSSTNAVYEFLLWNKANISSYATCGSSIQLRAGNTSAGGGNITGVRRGPANEGDLSFSTTDASGNPVEKLRISSVGDAKFVGIVTATEFIPTGTQQIGGRRNLLINGGMSVAQRGTAAVTASTSAAYRCVDRWKSDIDGSGGGTFSHAQSTDVPTGQGFRHSSVFTTVTQASQPTSESNHHQVYQMLEKQDIFQLGWGTANAKTCTLSFWVKGSITGTYGLWFSVYTSSNTQYYWTNYTINSANTWEKKTITVTGPTSGGNVNLVGYESNTGFRVEFVLGVGSDAETGTLNEWTTSSTFRAASGTVYLPENAGATLYLTGVQFEVGSLATPFEFRSYHDELLQCQRYYVEMGGGNYGDYTYMTGYMYDNGNRLAFGMYLPCCMRATPSISVTGNLNVREGGNTVAANSPAIGGYDLNSNWIACSIGMVSDMGSNGDPAALTNTNNAGIVLEAEL